MVRKPVQITAAIEAAFARLFAAYPHRRPNPRARALVAFARVVVEHGVDPEALIVAAGRWAEEVRRERIKSVSVPHAATWLNQHDFEDYLTPDVPASAEPAQPEPEHPMAHPMDWARPLVAAASWAAWFDRLTVSAEDGQTVITAPTAFARDRVRNDFGRLFRDHFGAVSWRIQGQDR